MKSRLIIWWRNFSQGRLLPPFLSVSRPRDKQNIQQTAGALLHLELRLQEPAQLGGREAFERDRAGMPAFAGEERRQQRDFQQGEEAEPHEPVVLPSFQVPLPSLRAGVGLFRCAAYISR